VAPVTVSLTVGHELVDSMRSLCNVVKGVTLKTADQWGVVLDSDRRLASQTFSDFKTEVRKKSEATLAAYMCAPSRSRAGGEAQGSYQVAVTLAPPGTGKSRFLDDAMRMPLESRDFDHILRLAISFSGTTFGLYHYPVSARILHQFFVRDVPLGEMSKLLGAIDKMLLAQFDGAGEDKVAPAVIAAIEALYFQQRGGKLGRTVLLVDEISKVEFQPSRGNEAMLATAAYNVQRRRLTTPNAANEEAAYRILANFVDDAPLSQSAKRGRRGCVITALKFVEAGAASKSSGRDLLWLPLGKFDVWDKTTQLHIADEARRFCHRENREPHRLLEVGEDVHVSVWPLLAGHWWASARHCLDVGAPARGWRQARPCFDKITFERLLCCASIHCLSVGICCRRCSVCRLGCWKASVS
jgi:hypothetical protein